MILKQLVALHMPLKTIQNKSIHVVFPVWYGVRQNRYSALKEAILDIILYGGDTRTWVRALESG